MYVCILHERIFPLIKNTNMNCQSPPRNVTFSKNFYKAQKFFMEKHVTTKGDVSLTVPIKGIPIGLTGNYSNENYDKEDSASNEAEAVNYVQSELKNEKAQIIAEIAFAYCQLLGDGSTDPAKLVAFDSYERVMRQLAGGFFGSPVRNTFEDEFYVNSRNMFVFFDGTKAVGKVDQSKYLTIRKKTSGNYNFEIKMEGSEPKYDNLVQLVKPADKNVSINDETHINIPLKISFDKNYDSTPQAKIILRHKPLYNQEIVINVHSIPLKDFYFKAN